MIGTALPPGGKPKNRRRRKKQKGKKIPHAVSGGMENRNENLDSPTPLSLPPSPPSPPQPPQPQPLPQQDTLLEPFIPPEASISFAADPDRNEPKIRDEALISDPWEAPVRIVADPPYPALLRQPAQIQPNTRKRFPIGLVILTVMVTLFFVIVLVGISWKNSTVLPFPTASEPAPETQPAVLEAETVLDSPSTAPAAKTERKSKLETKARLELQAKPETALKLEAEQKPDLTITQEALPDAEPAMLSLPSLPSNQQGRHNSAEIKVIE